MLYFLQEPTSDSEKPIAYKKLSHYLKENMCSVLVEVPTSFYPRVANG
jgi:hypothetical protein